MANSITFIALFLIVPAVVLAVPTEKCDTDSEPTSIKIDNCNAEYCEVKRGVASKFELTLKLDSDATNLTAALKAQFAGAWIPWTLGKQAKVCDNLLNGQKCPVKTGDEITYAPEVSIPRIAPVGTKVLVQIRITDDKRKGVVCTRIPVMVVA